MKSLGFSGVSRRAGSGVSRRATMGRRFSSIVPGGNEVTQRELDDDPRGEDENAVFNGQLNTHFRERQSESHTQFSDSFRL